MIGTLKEPIGLLSAFLNVNRNVSKQNVACTGETSSMILLSERYQSGRLIGFCNT